jgi:hypothetical protein
LTVVNVVGPFVPGLIAAAFQGADPNAGVKRSEGQGDSAAR